MKTYTYFILASEAEISQMRSLNAVFEHIEKIKPMLGGDISLEAITLLLKIFLDGEAREPIQVQYSWGDTATFYRIDAKLCETIAQTDHESLLDASVPWSEDKPWRGTNVNRVDLAGFILGLASLCKQVGNQRSLYILLSNEE